MKDYKLLLAGLILLLLAIFIALIAWLWTHNRKSIDPLPIMASENEPKAAKGDKTAKTVPDSILYVQQKACKCHWTISLSVLNLVILIFKC